MNARVDAARDTVDGHLPFARSLLWLGRSEGIGKLDQSKPNIVETLCRASVIVFRSVDQARLP